VLAALARESVIVTTNYDNLIETALEAAGKSYRRIVYVADGEHRGKFIVLTPGKSPYVLSEWDQTLDIEESRDITVIKMHGSPFIFENMGSYVVTEDDFINFLNITSLSSVIALAILLKPVRSHFLFLGYGLRDWHVRVLLYRLQSHQRLGRNSWAVQNDVSEFERQAWRSRRIALIAAELAEYALAMRDAAITSDLWPRGNGKQLL
jgi:hypothetical protein